jgi:membrane-bound lytic murein transglycosylase D
VKPKGDIFDIRAELFSEQDDWMAEGFVLPENLTINQTDVPLIQNQHVNRHLMYYTLRRPDVMERWLERSETYFPMMREIFEEEGVPKELIHLSMIEKRSGANSPKLGCRRRLMAVYPGNRCCVRPGSKLVD